VKTFYVLIADDHPAFREGVRLRLAREEGLEVAGIASNGREALELAVALSPDLLLLDMEMPELSGLEVARALRQANSRAKILPLSSHSDPEYVFGVLEDSASGYLMKDESLETIVRAIRSVLAGGVFISGRIAQQIVAGRMQRHKRKQNILAAADTLRAAGVTPRLMRILQFAAQGLGNQDIADKEFRSKHTIRNQVEQLKTCIGVSWRPALVAWAWKNGVLELDPDAYAESYAEYSRVHARGMDRETGA